MNDHPELPPLPRAYHSYQTSTNSDFGSTWASAYTKDQMREYVLADRAARQSPPTVTGSIGDDAEFDKMLANYTSGWQYGLKPSFEQYERLIAYIDARSPVAAAPRDRNAVLEEAAALFPQPLMEYDGCFIQEAIRALKTAAPESAEPSDPRIRAIAICEGGYQDDVTADWEFTDRGLLKFARRVLATSSAAKGDAA